MIDWLPLGSFFFQQRNDKNMTANQNPPDFSELEQLKLIITTSLK